MKTSRHYYAVLWSCGVAVWSDTGRPLRRVFRFLTPSARDSWVSQGNPWRNSAGYRETVSRAEVSAEIRRAIAYNPVSDAAPAWEWDEQSAAEILL